MKRCAIIDDYQECALDMADWAALGDAVSVTAFKNHIADEDVIAAALKDFDIICIMRERTPFPRGLFEKLPNLELLVTSGMRNFSIDGRAAIDHGVTLCGTPMLGYPTAELTWGLIISLVRGIAIEDRSTRLGTWQRTLGVGLNGKTLGVMGLGRQGAAVATVGNAFGMEVIAWSQNLTQERCDELGVTLVGKDELIERADVLTLHLILGERTRGIMQASDLARMKPSSYFINTSRGPLVDEAALISLLENKAIAGAAIDVFDVEPLPLDHPFRRLENTVITPHLGYVSLENYQQSYGAMVENIQAWLAGTPMRVFSPPSD
jgi:phosphoglycerate dehydrogenase-like enzyme